MVNISPKYQSTLTFMRVSSYLYHTFFVFTCALFQASSDPIHRWASCLYDSHLYSRSLHIHSYLCNCFQYGSTCSISSGTYCSCKNTLVVPSFAFYQMPQAFVSYNFVLRRKAYLQGMTQTRYSGSSCICKMYYTDPQPGNNHNTTSNSVILHSCKRRLDLRHALFASILISRTVYPDIALKSNLRILVCAESCGCRNYASCYLFFDVEYDQASRFRCLGCLLLRLDNRTDLVWLSSPHLESV